MGLDPASSSSIRKLKVLLLSYAQFKSPQIVRDCQTQSLELPRPNGQFVIVFHWRYSCAGRFNQVDNS